MAESEASAAGDDRDYQELKVQEQVNQLATVQFYLPSWPPAHLAILPGHLPTWPSCHCSPDHLQVARLAMGSIPRSIWVTLEDEQVDQVRPCPRGD